MKTPIPPRWLACAAVLLQSLLPHAANAEERPGGPWYHTVSEEIQTLGEISMYLYGKAGKHRQIADWNALEPPYRLPVGKRLVLREKPKLSPSEGSAKLLEMWRRLMKIDTAPRGAGAQLLPLMQLEDDEYISPDVAAALKVKVPTPPPPPALSNQELAKLVPEESVATTQAAGSGKVVEVLVKQAEKQVEEAAMIAEELPTSEGLFKAGETAFHQKQYDVAVLKFRQSRQMDPKSLSTWFYELRCWRLLKREDEVAGTAKMLIRAIPETQDLPVVRKYLTPPAQ